MSMPSRVHQTFSRLSPAQPREENGTPLSLRMRSGRPYARNARSHTVHAPAVVGGATVQAR